MNTQENNKLIAEFMNAPCCATNSPQYDFSEINIEDEVIHHNWVYLKHMKFHKSWDWLMPVVEKIQSLYETEEQFGIIISISTVDVRITGQGFSYIDNKPQKDWKPFDIDRVYKAVVKFIKWYNNERTNNKS